MNMKLFVQIFILTLVAVSSFGQNQTYFYGYKTRYDLTTDSIEAIILPRQVRTTLTQNDLLRTNDFLEASSINNRREALVKLSNKSILKKNNTEYDILPVFKHGEFPLIPTGEIVFKPKKGVNYNQIFNYCLGQLNFVKQTEYGTVTVKPKQFKDLLNLANKIYESSLVEWCEPDFLIEIVKHQTVTPTDQFYPQQYYLNQANNIDINAPQAWGLSRGINNVRVAVIDDGVEAHEDLNGRVVAGFTPTNQNGFGAPTNNPPPIEEGIIGHGQACAGIIGATHDNIGVAGVSPCAQIIPINIFNTWALDFNFPQGQRLRWLETAQEIAAGINWAWNPNFGNAQVLSNSWGYSTTNPNLIPQSGQIVQAINDARTLGRGGLGCIVIFSSGNAHQQFSGVTFPANVNGVVTVGAINKSNGAIHNYSSRGAEMDLVAPSGGIPGDLVTTDRMGNLGYNNGNNPNYAFNFNGTSAACPQVSGVAALMLSINPALTEAQVVNILRNTATDMGNAGFDNTFGFGRLNAQAAIQQVVPTLSGSGLICTNTNTITLSFIPQNTTVTWQVNPANLFTNATGNGATANLQAINANVSGAATITFTIQGNCRNMQLTQALWVGTPSITYNPTPPNLNPCSTTPYYSAPLISATYQWQVSNPNIWIIPPDNMWRLTTLSVEGEYFEITVSMSGGNCFATNTLTNQYGNALYCSCFYDPWQCPGQGGGWGLFSVYPNPAENYMEVQIEENEFKSSSFSSFEIVLLDNNGTEIFRSTTNDKSKRIDTSSIKNGQYFLHVMYKGEILKRQVFVSK